MSKEAAGKTRRLGKGLSALLQTGAPVEVPVKGGEAARPEAVGEEQAGVPDASGGTLVMVPLTALIASQWQPRIAFDEDELARLSQSIKTAGVIQPILVRKSPYGRGKYEIVAGERRWRAAHMAGLETIPALVRELSDVETAELGLMENLQRKDLDPMERAHALRRLNYEFGLPPAELADRIGLERSSVVNLIRVTELEDSVQGYIARGELTIGHGKVLLTVPSGERRVRIATRAVKNGWSVRELEKNLQDADSGIGPFAGVQAKESSPTLSDLERRLSEHLGTRVAIKASKSGTKGKVTLEFYSLDHFDGLMSKIGFVGGE